MGAGVGNRVLYSQNINGLTSACPVQVYLDLAKQVFAIHGVDQHGKTVLRQTLRRVQMVEFSTRITRCTVAME
jgi:hypothetical protein